MFTFHATEKINEVSSTRTTQVITRYFGRWPQTKYRFNEIAQFLFILSNIGA